MKQVIKRIQRVFLLAAAFLAGGLAWGESEESEELVKELVKWGAGEVSAGAKDGFLLTLGSGAAAGETAGTVKVTGSTENANTGLEVTWSEGAVNCDQLTVVVKYSGFAKTDANFALLGVQTDSTREVLAAAKGSENTIGESTVDIGGWHLVKTRVNYEIPTNGLMIVTVDRTGKFFTMGFATEAGLQKTQRDILPDDFDHGFVKLCVAGSQSSIYQYHRIGMTIEELALYKGDYTETLQKIGLNVAAVTLQDGETLELNADLVEKSLIEVSCAGSIRVTGTDNYLTAANFAKCSFSRVTGRVTLVLDSAKQYDFPMPEGTKVVYRYEGETALSALPFGTARYVGSSAGTIELACPVSSEGNVQATNNKKYVFDTGFSMTANKFINGNKTNGGDSSPQQSFVQKAGAITLNATKQNMNETTSDMPLLMAHWPSSVTYALEGGSLTCPNGTFAFGRDGTLAVTVGGGTTEATLSAYGISRNGRDNTSSLTIGDYGKVTVGAGGINFGTGKKVVLSGGTLAVSDSASVSSGPGITLTDGTVSTLEVPEGKTLTIGSDFNGAGAIRKTGSGTLALGTRRPKLDCAGGKLSLVASVSEIVSGCITFATPENPTTEVAVDTFQIADTNGRTVEVSDAAVADGVLTVSLNTLPRITEAKSISELKLADNAKGTLCIQGSKSAEGAFAVTFDTALPEGVSVAVTGFVTLTGENIPWNRVSLDNSTVTVSNSTETVSSMSGLTIPSGVTLIADTVTGDITNNGTLVVKGDSTFAIANNGTLTIASGVSTVSSKGGAQNIRGTVTVEKGATFKNVGNDAVPYSGAAVTFNVRGTLDMGETRWTLGSSDKLNLYGGCTVMGSGDDGNFDLFHAGDIISVSAGESGDSTTVTIPRVRSRARNDGNMPGILVAQNMTLVIANGITQTTESNHVCKRGLGKLIVAEYLRCGGFMLGQGTVELATGDNGSIAVSCPITNKPTVSGTGTVVLENGASLDFTNNSPKFNSKFAVAENATATLKLGKSDASVVIAEGDSKAAPFITVNTGATLNFYMKDLSSWNEAVTEYGWIKNNGRINIMENEGTRYFRTHLALVPGSTTTLSGTTYNLIVYGGNADTAKAQFYVPEPSGETKKAIFNGDGTIQFDVNGSGGTVGACADIEQGAELVISNKIIGVENLVKAGAGTLTLTNPDSTYTGTVSLKGGVIRSVKALTVKSGVEGKVVAQSKVGGTSYTYSLWDGAAQSEAPAVVIPEGTSEVQLIAGQTATYEGETAPSTVTITVPSMTDGTAIDVTGYFTVTAENGTISAALNDEVKPTVSAMAVPSEAGSGKVSFTIAKPKPGLFYAIATCDKPDGQFKDGTGEQAASGEKTKVLSIPLTTLLDESSVKYFKVTVKPTK